MCQLCYSTTRCHATSECEHDGNGDDRHDGLAGRVCSVLKARQSLPAGLVRAGGLLIRPQSWERHGLKPWIEAAKKRLHHNVLAIALANKLARIAWAVLNKERNFEVTRTTAPSSQPA